MRLLEQDMASLFVVKGQDWSSKAIIAALDRQGVSLSDLENELGVGRNAIRNVFYRRCGRYEEAIASKIGVEPSLIWPSRYPANNRMTA